MGMLVIGLLAGFGGGFVIGQRLAPPALPRTIEIPPPPPDVSPAAEAVPPPVSTQEPPVLPAQNYTEAPVIEVPAPEEVRGPSKVRATEQSTPVGRALLGSPRAPDTLRATGDLFLASRPAGATVYVDDARVGVTPMTIRNVSTGMHRIRLELFGHRTWVTSVNVEPAAQVRVGASLEEGS